jgi:hypothetical protein
MTRILISSYGGDAHAAAILWGLRALGCAASLWQPHLFPGRQALSIRFGAEGMRHLVEDADGTFDLAEVGTVWNRRAESPMLSPDIDARDRDFAQVESEQHLAGFLATACRRALWVNPPAATGFDTNKPLQLRLAAETGFAVPATLFSNSPDEIGRFFDAHDGDIVHKSYRPGWWAGEEGQAGPLVNHTAAIAREDLANRRALAMCPGIFQQRLAKAFEVRLTIMGGTCFGVRIDGGGSEAGRLDWRSDRCGMRLSPLPVPAEIAALCRSYMARAGLVFGCFDFIVTPALQWHFLEVNPMGQFLWQEERLPDLPLLDAMCAFLISGDPDFERRPRAPRVRFADFRTSRAAAARPLVEA